MTKFETRGVSMLLESNTKEDAMRRYERSCDICCNRGMRIDCDRCAIDHSYKLLIAAMETENKIERGVILC